MLGLARIGIRTLPFGALGRFLGARGESPMDDVPSAAGSLRRVAWALAAASAVAPWRCACLEQAIAAKAMLSMRGIPNTLYLGVARGRDGSGVSAHAWVRSGTTHVTGGRDVGPYAVVATFANRKLRSRRRLLPAA